MQVSIKSQIIDAIAQRLTKITTANGYALDVKKVLYDKIPMGIQLNVYQLPVIFLLDGPDSIEFEHSCVKGNWDFRLQLWHNNTVGDFTMLDFVRAVFKVIFADSPTAQRNDAFRALDNNIVEFIPLSISPDLNMIDANRVTEISFQIRYRTKLFDM